jgi:SAM-dependent methyltransferase
MEATPKTIYSDARLYDAWMDHTHDVAFYVRQTAESAGPVLELACGTGRLTIPMAQAGAEVVGLDLEPAMLEAARAKAATAGVAIDFVKGDAREFDLGRKFGLIIFPNNSLSHLLERKDVESCFRCVRRHLKPGGRFVIEIFTPLGKFLLREPKERYRIGEFEDPDGGGRIVMEEMGWYDSAAQVKHSVCTYERQGTGEKWEARLDLRMFYPQEIDALVEYNGFKIEAKYGDFEGTPFGPGAPKQVIVCS